MTQPPSCSTLAPHSGHSRMWAATAGTGLSDRAGAAGSAAQHLGLGRRLVERACEIARDEGYTRINVISAVGTRGYYRGLGFGDNGLYQRRDL